MLITHRPPRPRADSSTNEHPGLVALTAAVCRLSAEIMFVDFKVGESHECAGQVCLES